MRKTALLVIDVQVGIIEGPGMAGTKEVLTTIAGLLQKARDENIPIVYVQHDGPPGHRVEPGTRGWRIHPEIAPRGNEPVVRKRASDSFFETDLQQRLQQLGIDRLIVCGCMTPYCVDTTCRRAVSIGYDVTLVSDGHTTADTPALKASQIVAHHNDVLDGFDAGSRMISVLPAAEIRMSKESS